MENKIRVAILEDHPLSIEGYLSRLRGSAFIEIVGAVRYAEELDEMLKSNPTDVMILDVFVPVSKTNKSPYPILLSIPTLKQTYPRLEVLVVTMNENSTLIRSVMDAGACGYVLKDDMYFFDTMPEIIKLVSQGGVYMSPAARQQYFNRKSKSPELTDRQLQALSLCAAYPEMTTSELASRLQVADSTLRNLLSGAYEHLEVHSRVAAVSKAQQIGLIPPIRPEY